MLKLDRKILHKIFESDVKASLPSFVCETKNPFSTNLGNVYIFLKNISPAYFKNKDITRIQVRNAHQFKTIKDNNGVCIPVGYDSKNETYIVWDPQSFLERINNSKNISIYSRLAQQTLVTKKDYLTVSLSNEEVVYCVNKSFIGTFLKNIKKFYKEKTDPFIINEEYKKQDIYRIMNVSEEQQGGKWRKGYCGHAQQHYIFAHIQGVGKGFEGQEYNYNNGFNEEGDLKWEATNSSKIDWPSVKNISNSNPFIFVRDNETTKDSWRFIGQGKLKDIKDTTPVSMLWGIEKEDSKKTENLLEKELKEFINNNDFLGAVMYCVNNTDFPRKSIKNWRKELKHYFPISKQD